MRGGVGRILTIELTSRGFAFAVLEDGGGLLDWGTREVKGDVSAFLVRLAVLIERYAPADFVLEEPAFSRRKKRGREWLSWAEEFAADRGIACHPVSRDSLLSGSGADRSRYALAERVAERFPSLQPYVPARPKAWRREPALISVFVAVARASALLASRERAV